MTIQRFSLSATPGDALRPFFTSRAADTKGSYNLAGIKSPVMDILIEKIIAADSRADLTFACRALDRVFRAGRYWVPQCAIRWTTTPPRSASEPCGGMSPTRPPSSIRRNRSWPLISPVVSC
jgi:hypothetical protein